MLQAWERVCILLLVATLGLARGTHASQDETSGAAERVNRLNDTTVEEEHPLDSAVPGPDAVPAETESPREPLSQEELEREMKIEQALTAANRALREGRIDQPPGDCAWLHFRTALDLDPTNQAAIGGLLAVQNEMVDRAVGFAHELDFESAERMLEEALLVREDRAAVEAAQEQIRSIRLQHADQLESKVVKAMGDGDFQRAERLLIDLIALGDMDSTVSQLRRRLEEARVYGGFQPGQTVRDHFLDGEAWTPELVVVAAGSFVMGSSASEQGREDYEGPEHRVTFRRGFAIGRTEVTVKQFRAFSERTGFDTDAERAGYSTIYDHRSGRLMKRDGVTWEMDYDGRQASDDEPVVHISWNDAVAYTRWLARGTGKPYRLPTEAEFEYALRGGKRTRYWWGEGAPGEVVENLTGQGDVSRNQRQWSVYFKDYTDRYWGPAPVGSFEPNPYGLYDMGGNVAEWVMDCWHDTYLRAPVDGSAWINPGCKLRVVRGGYWASSPEQSRSAFRISAVPDRHDARIGFRVARDL
jgi:formylglycine-generating enzyme required for sulfatase activity